MQSKQIILLLSVLVCLSLASIEGPHFETETDHYGPELHKAHKKPASTNASDTTDELSLLEKFKLSPQFFCTENLSHLSSFLKGKEIGYKITGFSEKDEKKNCEKQFENGDIEKLEQIGLHLKDSDAAGCFNTMLYNVQNFENKEFSKKNYGFVLLSNLIKFYSRVDRFLDLKREKTFTVRYNQRDIEGVCKAYYGIVRTHKVIVDDLKKAGNKF